MAWASAAVAELGRVGSWGKQVFWMTAPGSWPKVLRGGRVVSTRRNEHKSGVESKTARNGDGQVSSRFSPSIFLVDSSSTCCKVEEMSIELPYLKVTPEMKSIVGKCDKGTRIHRREGSYAEAGKWFLQLDELFKDRFVSPGGVSMFVRISRAAVHKRMKEGRLSAFCFHVVHEEKTFFGNVRKAKATPFVTNPVSECKAWAKEIDEKRGQPEVLHESDLDDTFLVRDPDDSKNRKVRHSDKYLEKDTEEFIRQDMEEAKRERAQNKRER